MAYWIFVITNHPEHNLTSEEILDQRVRDRFFGLGEKTPNRRSLQAGDSAVFYLGNPIKAFAGTAVLNGPSFQLSPREIDEISHGSPFYRAAFGVRLGEINLWKERRSVENLLSQLGFIENKKSWGTYFQGGVKGISERDFETITKSPVDQPPAVIAAPNPVLYNSAYEFGLEAHLEDFIDDNWDRIDFGRRLARYKTDEQDGRQFPAGQWSIDFLCIDTVTGDLVVLELKRGKTSDAVIGQALRYMTWVRENLAKPGQAVHASIIASEADEAMRFAIRSAPNISLLEYRVDFKLQPVGK